MKLKRKITTMQVLEAIKAYKNIHSYSPSIRELGTILGVPSPGTVHHHLDRLKQMGYITSEPNKARSIIIIRKSKKPTRE